MAGNNGLAVGVRTIGKDGKAWTGLAQEMIAVEEEIKALVAISRQRLITAADKEMRRMLREATPGFSETSVPELLIQAREVIEAPLLVPEANSNAHEEPGTAASLNGHESSTTSPKGATDSLAELVARQEEDMRGHVSTQNGTVDNKETPLDVAVNGTPPATADTYSGTVQLVVAVEQSDSQALQFVDALCRHPSMRLQRLLGTAKGRLDIWLLLREPVQLEEALLGMEGVSQVNRISAHGPEDTGVRLEVRLKEPGAVYGS